METLSITQKKRLKSLAHDLKPVVMVGQHGLKETILEEIGIALAAHQLIKVKVSVGDRDARDEMIEEIVSTSESTLIQRIGNIAILYKKNKKKTSLLS